MQLLSGGTLRAIGEDVSEVLEYVPEHWKAASARASQVQLHVLRASRSSNPPSRPIERGYAGPGLLAHVVVSKYCDHQPLYRQSQIYARSGVELDRSTLAEWVGTLSHSIAPLTDASGNYVMGASKLHATHRFPCWRRAQGRRRPGDYGPMFAMISPPAARIRRPCCSDTRLIAKPSDHGRISKTSAGPCRPMQAMQVSRGCMIERTNCC